MLNNQKQCIMRISTLSRNAAIAGFAATLGLLAGNVAQAESLRIADNHGDAGSEMMMEEQTSEPGTIVDIASDSESFNTLVQAVEAADLGSTLAGEGPFTVFAPTDDAFAMLPEGALDYLLQPENQDVLAQVLQYHVVSGSVTSDQLSTGSVETLNGGVSVLVSDSGVVVNNASVVDADIQASNGVIHVINRVLIPEPLQQQLAAELGMADIY